VPHEPSAYWAAQFEFIADYDSLRQIRRDFASRDSLNRDFQAAIQVRCGGNGVGSYGRISIWRRESHVDVLAGDVTRPTADCKGYCPRGRCFITEIKNRRSMPRQSSE
jgi:hypothetical protein